MESSKNPTRFSRGSVKQKKISYKSQTAQGTNPLFDYIKKQEDEGDEEKCEKK